MDTIGILTSGGDAPGMNAAIRAAGMVALAQDVRVLGVRHGYRGLVEGEFVELTPPDLDGIHRLGGTILGSARCPEFHDPAVRDKARAAMAAAGMDKLLVIGGNGSLQGAALIGDPEEGGNATPAVIGVPASIDNDIGLTGMAIGVDTAINTIVEACDKIADTAGAHERTFLIEVMGRQCGYLAMTAAVASGADLALFPESRQTGDQIVEAVVERVLRVRQRPKRPKRVTIIVAEGVDIEINDLKERVDAELRERSPEKADLLQTRVTVLGHVVRGGRPSSFDRLLAGRLGTVGVRALLDGETNKMAAWMTALPMPDDIAARSVADPYCWLVDLHAMLAATEALLSGDSPLSQWRAQIFAELDDVFAL